MYTAKEAHAATKENDLLIVAIRKIEHKIVAASHNGEYTIRIDLGDILDRPLQKQDKILCDNILKKIKEAGFTVTIKVYNDHFCIFLIDWSVV